LTFTGLFREQRIAGIISSKQQKDLGRAIEIATRYGLEILPPPGGH